jgi:phthalate 4,5-cis-dihydrodiol dehydrogenase
MVAIGIAGLGAAGRAFIPAIRAHSGLTLAALCDPVAEVRTAVAAELGVHGYSTLQELLVHPGLDALYIATPTALHHEHAMAALAAGKHILLEKPMTARFEDARAVVGAAEQAGRVLVVGHSHSFDLPIARMREIVAGGTLGRVRMVNTWCYSDWMFRPRRGDELDAAQGGGATFRQGAHQFDILRLLCGGMARSVRARTFDWDPNRRGVGAHVVFIDF